MKDTIASVIIPVYNAENTIVRCVESIVYGLFKQIEVILVEDCSKDNSWNICQQLAEKYTNVFCYQNSENSGVSFSRNRGLQEAQGAYILFVDSDDWVSSRYADKLIKTAKQNREALPICGLHFLENVAGYERDYVWHEGGKPFYYVGREQFFELADKFHLQQLWNKVFRKDILECNNIKFDESQSMGEDYQFVLDYMEIAQIKQCVVLNEALYYYIRANTTSLMSKFGLIENMNAIERQKQLLRISGENNLQNKERYQKAYLQVKKNAIYHVVRSDVMTKKDKIVFIEGIMQDGRATNYYCQEKKIMLKEKLFALYRVLKKVVPRIRREINYIKCQHIIKKSKMQLSNRDVTIISQNCIGGVFYHDMGMKFLSPTINLFFRQPDFVRFAKNLKYYLDSELVMEWGERYPIGTIGGDVRIEFMHYNSCSEAKKSWEERKKRVNYDNIVVLSTDRNNFNDDIFAEWKEIPYPKVLFTVHEKYATEGETVLYSRYKEHGFVPDLIPKREFYRDNMLINIINRVG